MKLNSLKKPGLIVVVLAISFYSCTHKKADEVTPQPGQPVACDTTNLSFTGDIAPIIQQNCAISGCHNTTTRAGGYNYTTYNGFMAPVQNGRLLGAINHLSGYVPMPQNMPKLSDCEILKITHWIEIGAPNN